ncbi:hypothetical protein FACS1894132_08050 [Clostridia bacterium]|nr:hypothetical protein FACS1894132_08050 [Clostridia bacterium]
MKSEIKFAKGTDNYGEITELTAEVARSFIEKVIVHKSIRENATEGRIKYKKETSSFHTLTSLTLNDGGNPSGLSPLVF